MIRDIEEPSFSVVIVSWNRNLLLDRAIKSVLRAQKNHLVEIVVVDNNSKIIPNVAQYNKENIQLISLEDNYGPSIARNKGITAAVNQFIITLDDDDELSEDSFDIIQDEFTQKPSLFLECPVVFFARTSSRLIKQYELYNLDMYLHSDYGDLAPVISKALWEKNDYNFPNSRIGAEGLIWFVIARDYGLRIFNKIIKIEHSDAELRLTDAKNQVQRAVEYWAYQNSFLSLLYPMRKKYKKIFLKRCLALITYAILANKRLKTFKKLYELKQYNPFFYFLLLTPKFFVKKFIFQYRDRKSN